MSVDSERRRVVAALFFTLLLLWGTFEAQPVFIDALLHKYSWSYAQVSWIPAVSSLGIGLVGPLAGFLLDRFDARYVMGVGALLVGVGTLLSAASHGLAPLLVATAIYSLGLGASTVLPASAVVSNWYEARQRGAAIGLTLMGMEVGGMAFTLVCGTVIALAGWRTAFVVAGAPALLIAAPVLFFAVRTRPQSDLSGRTRAPQGRGLDDAIRSRTFWGLAGVQLASGLLIGGLFPFLVSFFIGLGHAHGLALVIVTASYGAVIVGKPVLGRLGDRFGGRFGLLLGFSCWTLLSFGLILGSRPWSAAIFLLFVGLALPAAIAMVPLIISSKFGLRRFGVIYGWLQVAYTAGLFLGPLIIGTLADLLGGYAAAFRVLPIIAAAGAAASFACGLTGGVATLEETQHG